MGPLITTRWLRWFVALALFVLCLAPTFISYRVYTFRWDDSVYLHQAITVSRAFWSSQAHGTAHVREILLAMYGHGERPPAMSLLGLPWGPLSSWSAAGDCFVTLVICISILAATCFYLLVRIGVEPLPLALACICVGGALGPWGHSSLNVWPTAFMADGLFAWTALACLLLIPYEARTSVEAAKDTSAHALLRGMLWGVLLSLGAMTKVSFLYLDVLILPCLLFARYRRGGLRSTAIAFAGAVISASPALLYLATYGRVSLRYGRASAFGNLSGLYENSFFAFVRDNLRSSPGLWFFVIGVSAALALIALKRPSRLFSPAMVAILIAAGFEVVVLLSPNREIRFSLAVILSLPFLSAILLSSLENPVPRELAFTMAAVALLALSFCTLPERHRAPRANTLARADAVLSQASRCGSRSIVIATNGSTLNDSLLDLAVDTSQNLGPLTIRQLNWSAVKNYPIADDHYLIQNSDLVVIQQPFIAPSFFNTRLNDYKSFLEGQKQFAPAKVTNDVTVYRKNCAL